MISGYVQTSSTPRRARVVGEKRLVRYQPRPRTYAKADTSRRYRMPYTDTAPTKEKERREPFEHPPRPPNDD